MNDELRKLLVLGLLAAGALTALLLLAPKVLGAAAGAEVEVLTALKEQEQRGLTLEVPGVATALSSTRVSYQRLQVTVQGEARALVTATLDFDGAIGATAVSSLGAERIGFERAEGGWVPSQGFAPRLVSVVRALERRRAALERGDLAGLCSGRADAGEAAELDELQAVSGRKLSATRWLIRSERDEVLVTEEWRLEGTLPSRPVDDRGSRRLLLQPAAAGQFCFPDGLM